MRNGGAKGRMVGLVLLLLLSACGKGGGPEGGPGEVQEVGGSDEADARGEVHARGDDGSAGDHGRAAAKDGGPGPDADSGDQPSADLLPLDGWEEEVTAPADLAIRFATPEEGQVHTGTLEIMLEPVEVVELEVDFLVVKVDGTTVFTDTKAPTRFILDTRLYPGPELALEAEAGIGTFTATDQVTVQLSNPPFGLKQVSSKHHLYRNGDDVSLFVAADKPGLELAADFSALDSAYEAGAEEVYEIGGGKYLVSYSVSLTNDVPDGWYVVPLVVSDGEFEVHHQQLELVLQNTPTLPVKLDGGIFVPGSLPTPDDGWGIPQPVLSGNEFIITGGSAKLKVDFTAYSYPEEIVGVLVAAEGYSGFYQKPLAQSPGNEELLLLLKTYVEGEEPPTSLSIRVGLRDVAGRISAFQTRVLAVESVGSGDVQVSISWDTDTDVDLHVVEPGGAELWYGDQTSWSGGELDLDSNPACSIDGVNNENVFWPEGQAPVGTYIVRVDFYMDCMECGWSYCGANYTVTTHFCGNVEFFDGSFAPGADDMGTEGSGVQVTSFSNENCGRVIRGKVRFEDKSFDRHGFSAATWREARYVTVELHRAADGALLSAGTTDRFGNYELQFSNPKEPGVYIVVKTVADLEEGLRLLTVMNHPKFNVIYQVTSPSVDETEADVPVIDFDIPEVAGAGAFNIFDVLADGYDGIRLMTGKELGQLNVYWATGADTTDTLFCSQHLYEQGVCSQMGALSVQGKDTDRDEYDDMVILKEFFKFALDRVSLDNNPGGAHDGTRGDPRRAWSEGVSTFFAGDVLGRPYFVNSRPAGVYLVDDLEAMTTPFAFSTTTATIFGPVSEYLVAAVLWDLADTESTEEFDEVFEARTGVYDAIINYLPSFYFVDRGVEGVDLVDFLDGWFCRGWKRLDEVSKLVVEHRDFPYDFDGPVDCTH